VVWAVQSAVLAGGVLSGWAGVMRLAR